MVVESQPGGDPAHRRIAYLETYGPDLKQALDERQSARRQGRIYAGPSLKGDAPFVLKNTLVKRIDDPHWYDMTTPEARRIISEWRGWITPDGQLYAICFP